MDWAVQQDTCRTQLAQMVSTHRHYPSLDNCLGQGCTAKPGGSEGNKVVCIECCIAVSGLTFCSLAATRVPLVAADNRLTGTPALLCDMMYNAAAAAVPHSAQQQEVLPGWCGCTQSSRHLSHSPTPIQRHLGSAGGWHTTACPCPTEALARAIPQQANCPTLRTSTSAHHTT
jgi:hypothetical protein